jgi:hypothetical protein
MNNKKNLSVDKFISKKCRFLSTMVYDPERYGWEINLDGLSTMPGVYFIVRDSLNKSSKFDILKVGKAEGKRGLRGRMQSYTSTSVARKDWDRTIRYIHDSMRTLLDNKGKHCEIKLYYFEIPMQTTLFEGYELNMSIIRSFENALSLQAGKEGHSMLLSGQD